jgi:hypothetical protein
MGDDYWEIQEVKRSCDDIKRDLRTLKSAQEADARSQSEAFNRLAQAIEGLAREVHAQREELGPQSLDKTKLPGPES